MYTDMEKYANIVTALFWQLKFLNTNTCIHRVSMFHVRSV